MTRVLARATRRAESISVLVGIVSMLALFPNAAAGTPQAPAPPDPDPILLTEPDVSPEVSLQIDARNDRFAFLIPVVTAGGCKYPVAFAMPVRPDGEVIQKRVARFSQRPLADGSCLEVLGTVFTTPEFAALARARRIELTLPTGAITLPPPAMEYVRSFPVAPLAAQEPPGAPPAPPADEFTSLSQEVLRLAGQGRYAQAVPVAERAVKASDGRSLSDRMMALSNFGYMKRKVGDQTGAAAAYQQAVAIADAAGSETGDLGIVLDNLARVRSATGDFVSAEALSLRAIAILRRTVGETDASYGQALNNLSLMYASQGDKAKALDYSNRAIDVLRQALAGDPAALEPFLEDNRAIKAAAARPKTPLG